MGGGCLLFLAHPGRRESLAHFLTQAGGARLIPFRFAFDGLTVSVEP